MTDRNLDSGSSRPTSSSTNKTSLKKNATTINNTNQKQTNELKQENSVEKTLQNTTIVTKTIVETKHIQTNNDTSIKLNKNQRRRLKQKQNKNNRSIIKNSDDIINNNDTSHTLIINENDTVNVETESSQNSSTIDTSACSNNVVNERISSLPSTLCSSTSSSQTTVIDYSVNNNSGVINNNKSYEMGGNSSKIEKNRRELIIESTEILNDDNEKCDENIKIQHNRNQNKTNLFETKPTNTPNQTATINLSDSQTFIEISSVPLDDDDECTSKYRVESPTPVVVVEEDRPNRGAIPKRKLLGEIKKSRSLDDNENVQIMEITDETATSQSEISQSESVASFTSSVDVNTAIVSDSEDDVQWETVPELRIPANTTSQIGSFSAIAKCLDETTAPFSTDPAAQRAYFTQDEMNNFREFLQELDLQSQYGCNILPSNFGQLCMKTVDSKTILSPEKILERRARKRALLESYFIPTFQNPRALDIIHEEGSSDLSDKEPSIRIHVQKPEPRPPLRSSPTDIPWIDEMGDDDVFLDGAQSDEKTPKLVEAKVINVGETVTQETTNWKTERVQSPHDENIEVVYIDEDDGSESSRSDRLSTTSCGDLDDAQEADDEYSKEETLLNQAVEEIKSRNIVETQSSLENILDLPFEMQDEQHEQLETAAMCSTTIENSKETKEKMVTAIKTEENIKNTKVKVENLQNIEKNTSKESNKTMQIDKNVQEHRKISSQNQEKVAKVQMNRTEEIIKVESKDQKLNKKEFEESTKNVRNIEIQMKTDNPKERITQLSMNPKDSDKKPEARNIDIKNETANDQNNEKFASQSQSKNAGDFEKANERVVEIKMEKPPKNPRNKNKKGEIRNIKIKIEGTSDQNIEKLASQQKITSIREGGKERNIAIKLEKSETNPKSATKKSDVRNIEIKMDETPSNANTESRTNEQKFANVKQVEESKERIVEIKLVKPTNPKETAKNPEIRNVKIKMEVENEQNIDKRINEEKFTNVKNFEESKEHIIDISLEKCATSPKETSKTPETGDVGIKMETAKKETTKKYAREQKFASVKSFEEVTDHVVEITVEKPATSPKETMKKSEIRNVEIKMESAKDQNSKTRTSQQESTSIKNLEDTKERVIEIKLEKSATSPKDTMKSPEVRNIEIKMETAKDQNTGKRINQQKSTSVKNLEDTKERVIEIKLEKSATSPKETMKSPGIRNVEIKMETAKDQKTGKGTSQQKSISVKNLEDTKERVIEIKLEKSATSPKETMKSPGIRNVEIRMETKEDQNTEKLEEATERVVEIKLEEPGTTPKEIAKKPGLRNIEIKMETAKDQNNEKCTTQQKLTSVRNFEEATERIVEIKVEEPAIKPKETHQKPEVRNIEIKLETSNQPKHTNIRDVEEKINMSETRNEEISFKCSKQKIEHNEPLEFYNMSKKQNETHTEINPERTKEPETKKEHVIKVQVQQNNNTKEQKITDSVPERTVPIKLECSSKESNTKSQTSQKERNVPIQFETSTTKTNEKYQSTNFTSGLDTNNTTTVKNLKTSIDTNQFSDEKIRRSISIEEKSLETREIHQTKHSRFLTNPIKNFEDLKLCQPNKSKHGSNEEKIAEDNLIDPELVLSNLISYGPEYFKESDMKIIRLNNQKIVEKIMQFLSKSRSDSDIKKISDFLQKVPMEGVERELQKKVQDLLVARGDDLEVEKIHFHGDNNNNHEKIVFDKEFESLLKTVKELSEERASAVPSRSESSNSFGSSSTTNTVKHMPTSSSLTDIHSIIEQELALTVKSLKEIALEKIKTLPYGLAILDELSHVSEIIKTMTKTLETTTNQHLHHNLLTNKKHHPKSAILIDDSPPPVPALPKNISTVDKYKNWIGLPTETDPRLLVCLSPAQRNYEHQQKSTSQHFKYINPDQLLDMHTKFMERRGYHESIPPLGENKTTSNNKTPLGSGHRLLRIIQEQKQPEKDIEVVVEPQPKTTTPGCVSDDEEISKYLGQSVERNYHSDTEFVPIKLTSQPYYTTSEPENAPQYQRSQSATLPQTRPLQSEIVEEKIFPYGTRKEPIFIPNLETYRRKHGVAGSPKAPLIDEKNDETKRLRIQSLSEWMSLARRKAESNETLLPSSVAKNTKEFDRQLSDNTKTAKSGADNELQSIYNRRFSLPQEIHEKQLKYILEKEREIEREIAELEAEKRRLASVMEETSTRIPIQTTTSETSSESEIKTEVEDRPEIRWLRRPNTMPASCMIYGDFFRKQMFDEYMSKIAEREERKQQKVIKISKSSNLETTTSNADVGDDADRRGSTTTSSVDPINFKTLVNIENEFMNRVKERKAKLGIHDMSSEDEGTTQNIPKHLQEFVQFTSTSESSEMIKSSTSSKDESSRVCIEESQMRQGVWSPGQKQQSSTSDKFSTFSETNIQKSTSQPNSLPLKSLQSTSINSTTTTTTPLSLTIKPASEVIWTPKSASPSPSVERKEFRPVNFQSPTLERKHKAEKTSNDKKPDIKDSIPPPPWENADSSQKTSNTSISSKTIESRLTTSHSAPVTGLNSLQATAASSASSLASHTTISTSTARLPRAQNPTITLLQKAREGQLPRGASYIDESKRTPPRKSSDERPPLIGPNEIHYTVKNDYLNDTKIDSPHRKMVDLGARKFEGIGPTTRDGMPIVLRSEVKENNQARWYKRMYETIHKTKDDDYVTIRYKQRKGRYPYTASSGYLSEPEPNADLYMYDSDAGVSPRCATLDRRYMQQSSRDKENYVSSTMPRNIRSMSASETIKHGSGIYRNQPGRIEDYVPGHSSISEKEAKEWWDEVMEIFNGHLEQQKLVPQHSKSYMAQALKESGYESDSTLIFKRRDDTTQQQLSPQEQKEVYKAIQRGGEVPLHGLRKPAPERPKESPRRYVENEVTIHYRSPVRQEIKEVIAEEELARRQAEAMRRIYQEERRRKYLQELHDMNSRRHTDNFTPSQKSPIPLNRYDDFDDMTLKSSKSRDRTPEPRLIARALFNFVGQSPRELTFKKGDIIYVRRQIDKNWYEGEHNAMLGLFPFNYVEIIPFDNVKTIAKKPHEGQARAKFNFIAQTHLELSLAKGEHVILTRRVDENWFEGRIGNKKGIFPVSYVEIISYPGETPSDLSKPVAAPAAHSLLLNGSAGGKQSMGSHHYQPTYSSQTSPMSSSYHHAKPVNITPISSGASQQYGSLSRQQPAAPQTASSKSSVNINQTLHIDTHSEPIPYRALYKYRPQNEDELELLEGDIVYVLEKCDDGWFVGSSQRTGAFGTFPGNYVERVK